MPRFLFFVSVCLTLAFPALAEIRDDAREVVVVTRDEDGELRERRIWFARVDGALYVRTTPLSTWGGNVERTGRLELAAEGVRHPFRAERIEDESTVEAVNAGFRAKYGEDDGWADLMRALWGGKVTYSLTPDVAPRVPVAAPD